MKKLSILSIFMVSLATLVCAQKATLNVEIKNSAVSNFYLAVPTHTLYGDYFKRRLRMVPLINGKARVSVPLMQPAFAYITFLNNDSQQPKSYQYQLYLSTGNKLNINADAKNGKVTVTGIGSNNNQPLLGDIWTAYASQLNGDTLPHRIIAFANQYQQTLRSAYNKYIKTYNPSADFVKNKNEDIKYNTLNIYYTFKENNKYEIREAYERNKPIWQKIQDSLLKTVKFNNSNALEALSYQQFLKEFLLREKERLWKEAYLHPVEFYRTYYNTDTAAGKKLFEADVENLLSEKIVNQNFNKAVGEYGYILVIDKALSEHNPRNLLAIYNRFVQKYPGSRYRSLFKPVIDSVAALEKKPLTGNMIFLPQNGTNLKSFKEILALAKGKTVLLDMWGTWCVPCRNELSNYSAAIKTYFSNKQLDYFYVANEDLAHVDQWKKLVAYYNLNGTHILASSVLSEDIMATVKGRGYPTYIIIKKDGSWELSKSGLSGRDVLIKQLEAALAL